MQINSSLIGIEEEEKTVIMDITEAFRTEDISKTDFFDFVVTPETNDSHSIQQFTKQMRNVNAFLTNTNGSHEEKEQNNNIEFNPNIPNSNNNNNNNDCINFDTSSFWSDKDTVKLETAILEDLNKYCWTTAEDSVAHTKSEGQIYTTLTVLNNGLDNSATWYRPPLSVVKEEESSISSPNSMELQANLDIDSILSIIPGQLNGFSGVNTDGLIKSETYTYEDSGFADNKEELANSLIIDTPLLEAHDSFNNNNNDWKLANQNAPNSNSSSDSLLRSALQGKPYNNVQRYNNGSKVKVENNELRRVLSTPTAKNENNNIYNLKSVEEAQSDQVSNQHIPTIVAGIDANGKVIFEEHVISSHRSHENSNNPSSTQSMNDLLLCQLEQYPDDFEKLKKIADEVAESVNQFCQIDPYIDQPINSLNNLNSLNGLNAAPVQISTVNIVSSTNKPTSTTTTTTPTSKKYKRAGGGSKATNVQSATSSSGGSGAGNGIRKERSLHYCSICSKGFKDKYSVNVHIRTHTGEKPFTCSLCGKSFRQKAHLAKHYQTHIAQKNAAAAGGAVGAKTNKSR